MKIKCPHVRVKFNQILQIHYNTHMLTDAHYHFNSQYELAGSHKANQWKLGLGRQWESHIRWWSIVDSINHHLM